MNHRSHRPAPERQARSRLTQLIAEQPFLRGSLVQRARSCGKPTCRCQKGQLHRSLYLDTRHQGRRALLYVPRALEDTVRQWVLNGRSLSQQFQDLHQLQLDQFLQRKQQLLQRRPRTKAERPDSSP
jgi:Family of unknown function (DUF6788)